MNMTVGYLNHAACKLIYSSMWLGSNVEIRNGLPGTSCIKLAERQVRVCATTAHL